MDQILIIDDDVALCELVTEYLEPLGFEIESVHRGDTGAERALAGKHSLVVLDVMLPGLNGFEVLRRIRARLENSGADVNGARRRRRSHCRTGNRRRRLLAEAFQPAGTVGPDSRHPAPCEIGRTR